MPETDGSKSFYIFDIDDNLLCLGTQIYLWNARRQVERAVGPRDFAAIHNELGCSEKWQSWGIGEKTFRDFRDKPHLPVDEQSFLTDVLAATLS
ncbi:MAG: hypothetical protein ABI693_32345, partial [Bryobacteraceae bacterium]